LYDVVKVALAEIWQVDKSGQQSPPRTPAELLRLVYLLLVVNPDGNVQFRSTSLRDFLLQSRYLAPENGDECMARMCLGYLSEDDQHHILKPWSRHNKAFKVTGRRPFFNYAANHWHRHYRAAEDESNDLAARLHQKLEREAVAVWGHQGLLHIELQDLCLRMGLAVCTYYGFQLLTEIYQQMGASTSESELTSILVPFPRPLERSLLFMAANVIGRDMIGCAANPGTLDAIYETTLLPLKGELSWVESLTDGESNLEESWASLPAGSQQEQWIFDFDDLRLDYDEHVSVQQHNRKGFEDGWEVIDRKPGFGH
jgi:hypothetical protein